jgi:NitT/TauT family transport system permease protein
MPKALASLGWTLVSLAALVAVWQVAAAFADSRVLPAPIAVVDAFWRHTRSGELPENVAITLGRVAASFILALVIGSAVGIALGRSPTANRLFDGWLILFLNLPALVIIILCYVWFGLTEVAAILAVTLNKIPNVAVTLREGARALSRDLDEMASVYRFSYGRRLRHVVLPQLQPYFAGAARSGLALVWKIVLVVELLGRSNGVGFELHLYFQLFDVASILAYTIAFILVVEAIELLILKPWEQAVGRWRR